MHKFVFLSFIKKIDYMVRQRNITKYHPYLESTTTSDVKSVVCYKSYKNVYQIQNTKSKHFWKALAMMALSILIVIVSGVLFKIHIMMS